MKTAARKAKGRRLQQSVTLKFRELFSGILSSDDIQSQVMGVNGADVVLSPSAKNLIPFDVECKNQEAFESAVMKDAIIQAESNSSEGRIPLLVFKRNGEPERVILKLDDFLSLLYPQKSVILSSDESKKLLIQVEQLKQAILTATKESA